MPLTFSVIVETGVLLGYQHCLLGVNPDPMPYLVYHLSFFMDFSITDMTAVHSIIYCEFVLQYSYLLTY
jgi:hypothetical protein